jgi:hypothetical protein
MQIRLAADIIGTFNLSNNNDVLKALDYVLDEVSDGVDDVLDLPGYVPYWNKIKKVCQDIRRTSLKHLQLKLMYGSPSLKRTQQRSSTLYLVHLRRA